MLDVLDEIGQSLIAKDDPQHARQLGQQVIPLDPQRFYEDFGLFEHPRTREPVKKLATYQYRSWWEGWFYPYRLTIKSQKIGFSRSSLMEDFQHAITENRGRQTLVIAQSLALGKEHLYNLRKDILSSAKYREWLITKPIEVLLKDEVTKVHVIFLHNPDNPFNPTRIIGLGPKESGLWSWRDVGYIHMSDVAALNQVDDSGVFGAAFSRLANTQGRINIETPPRGQRGYVYRLYKENKLRNPPPIAEEAITIDGPSAMSAIERQFIVREYDYTHGIAAGVMTPEFIEGERRNLGPKFAQYYECAFISDSNQWYTSGYFDDVSDEEMITW